MAMVVTGVHDRTEWKFDCTTLARDCSEIHGSIGTLDELSSVDTGCTLMAIGG